MENKNQSQDDVIQAILAIGSIAGIVAFGPALGLGAYIWFRTEYFRAVSKMKLFLWGMGFVLTGMMGWILWLDRFPLYYLDFLNQKAFYQLKWVVVFRMLDFGWWMGVGAVLMLSPFVIAFKKSGAGLKSSDFKVKIKDTKKFFKVFKNREQIPLGYDLKQGVVSYLTEEQCSSHVLILGATGSGKTTLIVLMILHAIFHRRPCIVIDPKGSETTLNFIKKIGRMLSPDLDSRFRVFRMNKPKESCQYNPLKHGNASQIKDRILEALNWSEQFYQSVAGDFLTTITACAEFLGMTLTLGDVVALTSRLKLNEMSTKLRELAETQNPGAKILHERLKDLIAKTKESDLLGLQAQLLVLYSPSLMSVFAPTDPKKEIDLREVLAKNQIAYFQLSTLGNPDTARRLGRMITEDIKGLASYVLDNIHEDDRKFLPIFIDEFGSFASKEFIENIKQVREAKFGVHLSTQGLEDLDVVSPAFRRQASSNPMTKIAFRLDDSETVDEICSMAGTAEGEEQSYQVEGQWMPKKTGLGNMRKTRQMMIEHDVLKNLNVGQAVVIEKSPSRVTALRVFDPGNLV